MFCSFYQEKFRKQDLLKETNGQRDIAVVPTSRQQLRWGHLTQGVPLTLMMSSNKGGGKVFAYLLWVLYMLLVLAYF